jgi:hypothetical protein
MENHENNGHGNSHDDAHTEGNRQYYPKGWWVPLAGLATVALGFALLGGFIFSVSGTERWGQTHPGTVITSEDHVHDAVEGATNSTPPANVDVPADSTKKDTATHAKENIKPVH